MHRSHVAGFVLLALMAAIVLPGSVSSAPGSGVAETGAGTAAIVTCQNFKATKIDGVASDDNLPTTSTSFADIPGMALVVRIGGTATTCVKIEYSAGAFAPLGRVMFVRAIRDGVACAPITLQFAGDSNRASEAHAYNFLCTNVTPGDRTFKIQQRSADGQQVATDRPSMFVHHR